MSERMEQILFGCCEQELDLSFTFSDHSLSSDEDLLSIDCCQTIATNEDIDAINGDKQCQSIDKIGNCSTKSSEKRIQTISGINAINGSEELSVWTKSDINSDNCSHYYNSCPLCNSFGPKSINHIKLCANKRSVDPKRVVQLLKNCRKTDQSIDCRKNRKTNSKSNKLTNNYVISFETQKPLKLSIDPKLISRKNSKLSKSKYELSALDPIERQTLLMSKISEEMINNYENEVKEQIECKSNSDIVLPNIWRLSSLDSNSDEYFVDGFKKYAKL